MNQADIASALASGTVTLPVGTTDLSGSTGMAAIDLSKITNPVTIEGAGSENTRLVLPLNIRGIFGHPIPNVTLRGLTLLRPGRHTTQGVVVSCTPGMVVVDIPSGFPTPGDVFDPALNQGRYLRRYNGAKIVPDNNKQVAWSTATEILGSRWAISLTDSSLNPGYMPGTLLGIKAKHLADTMWLANGGSLTISDVVLLDSSRCLLENIGVSISNMVIRNDGQINGVTACLSTNEGGPQIVNCQNVTVDGFDAENTGDDSLAFYGSSGTVSNARIMDSFARGILLDQSPGVALYNSVQTIRCPIETM